MGAVDGDVQKRETIIGFDDHRRALLDHKRKRIGGAQVHHTTHLFLIKGDTRVRLKKGCNSTQVVFVDQVEEVVG